MKLSDLKGLDMDEGMALIEEHMSQKRKKSPISARMRHKGVAKKVRRKIRKSQKLARKKNR